VRVYCVNVIEEKQVGSYGKGTLLIGLLMTNVAAVVHAPVPYYVMMCWGSNLFFLEIKLHYELTFKIVIKFPNY
jgi:hypothetical protein